MKNFILILCLATFSQWVYAQNKQITGRVVDTKGSKRQPLPMLIQSAVLHGTTSGQNFIPSRTKRPGCSHLNYHP